MHAAVVVVTVAAGPLPVPSVVDRTTLEENVAGRDVDDARALWRPVAGVPGPVVPGPIPVAVHPRVTPSGRRRPVLNDWLRRSDRRVDGGIFGPDVRLPAHRDGGGRGAHHASRAERRGYGTSQP